jgi:hypothetical protein
MLLRILGEHPSAKDSHGRLKSRIASDLQAVRDATVSMLPSEDNLCVAAPSQPESTSDLTEKV